MRTPSVRARLPHPFRGFVLLGVMLALVVGFSAHVSTSVRAQAPDQAPGILPFPPIQPGRITVSAGGPYSGTVGQPVIMSATVRSPLPPGTAFQFQWSFGDGSTGFGQTTSKVYAQGGSYSVAVTVFGGGQTAFSNTSVSVSQPISPLQVSTGGPYSGQVGQPVQFQSFLSGVPFGASVSYQWSFGDGTFGSGANPARIYAAPGAYTVTVQVYTSSGQRGSASTSVAISQPFSPLSVSAGGPYSGQAGSTIIFSGVASGAQRPVYQWNFGDGGVAGGSSVTHVYATAGVYNVTLTVTDTATGQSATASTSTQVNAVPTPPQPTPPPLPEEPNARIYASMAYFPPTGTVIMFGGLECGGSQCTDQNDTWSWDGSTWTQLSPSNTPGTRYAASLAYHAPSGRLVLFGGVDCEGATCTDQGDTWLWDGATWNPVNPAASPPERSNGMLASDRTGNLLLFGGQDTGGDILNDTWTWNGTTWALQSPAVRPAARYAGGIAFDSSRGVTLLFGGRTDEPGVVGDTWAWNGSEWSQLAPAVSPAARAWPAMEYDSVRNLIVLFSGADSGNNAMADTWTWDGTGWTLATPQQTPTARYGAASTYNAGRSRMVVFSGTNGDSDTWTYNGTTWTLRSSQ